MKGFLVGLLKAVGQAAKEKVEGLVPGTDKVIDGITKLFDHDNSNNVDGLVEIEGGVVSALQAIDPEHVDNAVLLADGITELKAAFDKIRLSLKK